MKIRVEIIFQLKEDLGLKEIFFKDGKDMSICICGGRLVEEKNFKDK